MPRALVASVVALAVLVAATATAGPSPRQILEASDRARGKLPGVVWTVGMLSVEKGRETEQILEVAASGDNALIKIASPPRAKGQMFLFVGRNMWFIKPGVSKPVPISPRQKMMGQAANGDIASTNYAGDYEATLTGEEAVEGEACYVLDLKASSKNVTYDRIVYWVSKERLVGVKADFYTVSGKKFKAATFEYAHTVSHGAERLPFVSRMVIADALEAGDVTKLTYSAIRVEPVPDATFNLNLLVR